MISILTFLTEAMKLVPGIINSGQEIEPFAAAVYEVISNGVAPSDEDWVALKDSERPLRRDLQAPL